MSDEIGDLDFDSAPDTTLLVTPLDKAAMADDRGFVLEKGDRAHAATLRNEAREGAAPGSDPLGGTGSRGRIGSFLIVREIGRGGMGVVYEATEEILNRKVALKVLPLAALMDEQQIRRFRNEAAAAAQLIHPNIVPVYSVGSDRGVHFYAMQLIEGQNIAQVIGSIRGRLSSEQQKKQNPTPRAAGATQHSDESPGPIQKEGKVQSHASSGRHLMEDDFAAAVSGRRHPLPSQRLFKTVAALGRDAALAIGHAHDHGIIHRDIKPSNLLLDEKGKIWITDFGLAQIRDNPGETRTGDIVGTLRYMSPEQASGRKFLVDHRTDIYSLGITLYELLTLKQAFNGKGTKEILRQVAFEDPVSLRQVNPRIPAELEVIISKAIGKNPQERYNTATELADDLERFCNDQPIAAKPPSSVQRFRRWMTKHQTLSGMIGVGLGIVFLSSVAMSAVIWNSLQQETTQRKKATELLDRSEGLRLIANSSLTLPENPGLALALAVEGSKHVSGLEVNRAVQAAMDANHELRVVLPREAVTDSIAVDSRGRRMVSTVSPDFFGTGNFPAIVTDLRTGSELARLDSGGAVTSAVFSPHGEWVLTASCGIRPHSRTAIAPDRIGSPSLWDASTGRRLTTYAQHPLLEARPEMFAPDSSAIVLPGPENDATVYNTASHNRSFAMRGHSQPVLQAVFSPDGTRIATADQHGEIRIWNSTDGVLQKTIPGSNQQRCNLLQFSFDSKSVIFAGENGTRVFSATVEDRQVVFWNEPNAVASPQHNRVASFWNGNDRVIVRDHSTNSAVCEIQASDQIGNAAFSDDGHQLAVAAGSILGVYDAGTGLLLYELRGHTSRILSVAFDKSQGSWVTAADDATCRFWDSKSGASRQKFAAASDGRASGNIDFSADSRFMLAASTTQDQTLLFDASGQRLQGVTSGALQSDAFERGLLPLVNGSTVSVVDPETSRVRKSRTFDNQRIMEVVSLPGTDALLIIVGSGMSVRWNTTNDEVLPMTQTGDMVVSFDVERDGMLFLLGSADGKCLLYESATGNLLRTIPHASSVAAVRFVPRGKQLVTIDDSDTVRIWGESDAVAEKTIHRDGLFFNNCYVSPDARFIVTFDESEQQQPVCCWDLATGELLRQTPGARRLKVTPHPAKPVLVLGSRSNGLTTWDPEMDELRVVSKDPVTETAVLGDRIFAVQYPSDNGLSGNDWLWQPQKALTSVRIYSLDTGDQIAEVPATDGSYRTRLCTNQADQRVAISAKLYSATVCEREGQHTETPIGGHTAPISLSRFAGNTGKVVTASWDGSAKIWGDGFQPLFTLGIGSQPISAGAVTRDGKTLACGHADGSIVLWDILAGQHLVTLKGTADPVLSLTFDHAGQDLLSAQPDGVVRYWNLLSREFREIKVAGQNMTARLSPNGRFALIVTLYGRLASNEDPARETSSIVWDLSTGTTLTIADSVGAGAGQFCHSSNRFVLVHRDGTASVMEIAPDGLVSVARTIRSRTGSIRNAAFSPDDSIIATLNQTGISLWEVGSGAEIHRIPTGKSSWFASGDPTTAEQWTPFSADGLWMGLTGTDTRIRAVLPPTVARDFSSRSLLPAERDLFDVGLVKLVVNQNE